MRGRGALRQRVVAGIGEVVTVPRAARAVGQGFGDGVIRIDDPHGRGVGNGGHARLLPLLLVSVNHEQPQEEEDHEHQDDDARDGSDLVGISRQCGTGSA